ncbi:MAG: hypothetical protein BWY30_00999 [Tenericutes bacterium ADurb.Bin239]|jgi:uncharacterized alkaline shock family protein YloU|nr:MAG: hypothetical protein BWY30_00999 [Tenericutes bacterium ADurb.Bin239]
MDTKTKTPFGGITISEEAIASAAVEAATSCYGVIGIANQPPKSWLREIFNVDPEPGVVVKKKSGSWHVSLYLNVMYGLKLTEIISAVQDQVKYSLEKTFDIKFKAINIFIVGVEER